MNEELYQILKQSCNSNGLPVMNRSQFVATVDKFGKEDFRTTLAEYITKEKPPFPFHEFDQKKVVDTFHKLVKADFTDFVTTSKNDRVIEKYDDYKYPYSKYGLGVIEASPKFNYVSDSFMNDLRLACGSYGYKSPVQRWNDCDNLWGAFGPIFRGVNDTQELNGRIFIMAFRLGTYIATQFKPIVAKVIYEMSDAKTVLDTSMGWGDRLTGFYASNATHYIGCDPNPNTFARYKKMIEFYDKLTGGKKTTQIYNCGAEDLPWNEIKNVDCAFTSPPYFSTERYNEGGEKEELQSWAKFNEYDKWRDDFFLPVSEQCIKKSKHTLINIMDPKIKGKRYRTGDELCDKYKEKFKGQIGMRIMQRPKSDKLFKDEQEKKEFMNNIFIENIWYFSNENTDLFKKSTLDEFFA